MEKKSAAKPMENSGAPKKARIVTKPAAATKAPPREEGQDAKTIQAGCKNGHGACERCCSRLKGACYCCREPIGDIRCLPLEKLIAGMAMPCAFARNGCTRRLKFAEKRIHEALLCPHAPCACPVKGCAYSGVNLHDHIRDAHAAAAGAGDSAAVLSFVRSTPVTLHRGTPFRVLLHTVDARVFLRLNGRDVPGGRSLSVVCLGPRGPAGNQALEYKVEVSAGGAAATLSMSASGPVPCTRRWAGHYPTDGFLFVPDAYWSSTGSVSVTVKVRSWTVHKV
ncbi:hypothetical protein EJB05_31816, partial [Eragrostis curvula]